MNFANLLLAGRNAPSIRNGQQKFRKDFSVKGLRPPKAALRALDRRLSLIEKNFNEPRSGEPK